MVFYLRIESFQLKIQHSQIDTVLEQLNFSSYQIILLILLQELVDYMMGLVVCFRL